MIDDVIDPRETRPVVCRALEMADGKTAERHGSATRSCRCGATSVDIGGKDRPARAS
jgi:hypothetical protein